MFYLPILRSTMSESKIIIRGHNTRTRPVTNNAKWESHQTEHARTRSRMCAKCQSVNAGNSTTATV